MIDMRNKIYVLNDIEYVTSLYFYIIITPYLCHLVTKYNAHTEPLYYGVLAKGRSVLVAIPARLEDNVK